MVGVLVCGADNQLRRELGQYSAALHRRRRLKRRLMLQLRRCSQIPLPLVQLVACC